MDLQPINIKVCVNEGEQLAVIEEFLTSGSPFVAKYHNPMRVSLDGDDTSINVPLPEYKREPMESEYRQLEEINNKYNAYEFKCADKMPTILINGCKWDGRRFVRSV